MMFQGIVASNGREIGVLAWLQIQDAYLLVASRRAAKKRQQTTLGVFRILEKKE